MPTRKYSVDAVLTQVYHLAEEYERATGLSPLASRKATQRLRLAATKAKELLSTGEEARVRPLPQQPVNTLNHFQGVCMWAALSQMTYLSALLTVHSMVSSQCTTCPA